MSLVQYQITRSELTGLDALCHGIVVREGIEDACSKSATTVLYDPEAADVWPACTWHANRNGGALTLAEIREALETGSVEITREVEDY